MDELILNLLRNMFLGLLFLAAAIVLIVAAPVLMAVRFVWIRLKPKGVIA